VTIRNSNILEAVLELAAQEAANGGYAVITPAHLLMALCKLSEAEEVGTMPDVIARLRHEFEQIGIETRTFRRGLRTLIGNGGSPSQRGVRHRSPSCRALFGLAEKLAAQAGSRVEPIHLLRAAFLGLREVVSEGQTPGRGGAEEEVPNEL
jgi:hypothetical protein